MPYTIGQTTDRWTPSSGHTKATRQLCQRSDCCASRRPALRDPQRSYKDPKRNGHSLRTYAGIRALHAVTLGS